MKPTFALLILSLFAYGQKPDAWVTAQAKADPWVFIQKTAKEIPASPIDRAGKLFAIAQCYEYLNREDIATKYFLLSKKEYEKLKLVPAAKEVALAIHRVISSQENYNKYGRVFINEFYTYALKTASAERLAKSWNEFGKIAYDNYRNTDEERHLDSSVAYYNKALNYSFRAKKPDVISDIYNNLATTLCQQGKFKDARINLDKSKAINLKNFDSYSMLCYNYNYGITYFYEGHFNTALLWLKRAEKFKIPKYRDKIRRGLYLKLKQTYDTLNDQKNRRIYDSLYYDIDSRINDEKQNIAIHDINVKYQVDEKNKEISALEKFREKFYRNRLLFGILLFLVFLLALYSFIRWKKLDFHKKKLEQEKQKVQLEKLEIEEKHSKTVEELEKVTRIVTEGHIMLKDKTKVYLKDLMYVKSDDHYLYLYTHDGKNHFVREKLKDIMEELPPNFIKCQKSYIVNTNFIKSVNQGFITLQNNAEIPVSRGFKL